MSLFKELKRRNVFKVAIVYIIVGWLLLQVSDTLAPALRLPEWIHSAVAFVLILGLPIAVVFAWAYELTPEGLKKEKDVDRSESITHVTSRRIDFVIIGLMAVALIYFAADKFLGTPARDAAQATAEVSEESVLSIAVLPFVNMSNDPEQEYFSDGISEELLNVLAQYPDLRVAARTSSFQFKGQNPDIKDIAEKLHVNYVLEGSVRKSGNTLRITAQLIEVDTGFHLWSATYDRELIDVFAIQDEISAAIGNALKIQLALDSGAGKTSPTVLVASNTAAFDAYMQGRQLINLRGKQNLDEAVTHLERALALDETYAPAHAQLAIAIALLSNSPGSYGDLTLEEVKRRATPHIERAQELDENLPEAFGARTILSLMAADYEVMVSNADRSLELNPSYADALNWLYLGNLSIGQYVEAYEALTRLLAVDPLSIVGRYNRSNKLALVGSQMGAARAMADSISEQSPSFSYATNGAISFYAGNSDEAVEWYLKSISLDPQDSFININMSRVLGQLNLLPEALRLATGVHYWAYLNMRMWPELIVVARQRLERDPSDRNSQLFLANALHLSGDIDQAQVLYEGVLSRHPHPLIIDTTSETIAATARAALGRRKSGDEAGALKLIELTTEDLRQRNRAGLVHGEYYRAAAIIAALEGDKGSALENIEKAIERGPRDPSLFSEPAFDALRDSPEFKALESRADSILAAQRVKALQMMCFNNPVPETWQPLTETCEGVATGGRD